MNEKSKIPLTERAGLSVEETAELLGLGVSVVYRLVHTEGFPAFKVGTKWTISRNKLFEWVDKQAEGVSA